MRKTSVVSLAIAIISISFILCGCASTVSSETPYPALVAWNYIVYGLSVETVPMENIDMVLGQVKRNIFPLPTQNGDSNVASVGSTIYKLKGISSLDAIAVDMGGKLYKAYNNWPLQ